ncbi:MAG: cytochrome P450 [Trichormus sp. ATA11-4-KO1]|jgi:cytochrome P450|nr:cytochrome P450 [Trichormus sp. ATA11-4-KO1]
MSALDGPRNSSLVQALQLFLRPLETLDAWHQSYGDTFRVLANELPPVVYFSSPESIQKIFTSDPEYLSPNRKFNSLTFLLGENSLISLSGEQHQRQKKMLMPCFHSERIREYSQIICAVTEQVISRWSPGKFIVVNSLMKEISLEIILNVVFGLKAGVLYNQLEKELLKLFDLINHPLTLISATILPILQESLKIQVQQLDRVLYALIAEAKKQGTASCSNILAMLLEARDESGQLMKETEVRDSLITIVFAGYENTAAALSWSLYWSHYLPEVHKNLINEIISVGDKSEIARLPYLSAVCSEALRLYPISLLSFSRFVQKPIEIMGYWFEPETSVNVSIYLAHHRPETYPEPKQFKPERFLERQFSPYEYLPFGGGNRRCIGAALAQLEIKLVLGTILSRLKLALVVNRPIKPVRRGFIMVPPEFEMVVTGVR